MLNGSFAILFGTLLKRILGSLFCKNKQKISKQFNSIDAMRGYYVSARPHTVQVQSFETLLSVLFMV